MTAAVCINVGMEIEAGGRSGGAGLGAGQSLAAGPGAIGQSAAWPGKGPSACWLSAARAATEPSVSGTESFQSRWQAMIDGLEKWPGAGLKTGLNARQETESGTKQGTAARTRPGTGAEAEYTDENAGVGKGIGGAQERSLINFANRNSAAASPNTANSVPQYSEATEQTNKPVAGTTVATQTRSQSGVFALKVATAPQAQFAADAHTSEIAYSSSANRSAKNDKQNSLLPQTNAEPQAATSNDGQLAMPIAVAANPIMPAPAMPAQIQAANFSAAPQSNLADGALNMNREQDGGEGAAAESVTTLRSSATGAAGMAARDGMNPPAKAGNPAIATLSGTEDSKTSGVLAIASAETAASPTSQPAVLAGPMEGLVAVTQQEPASSRHRTGSGNPIVDAAKANSGMYKETNPGATGNNVFASQSPAAIYVCGEVQFRWRKAVAQRGSDAVCASGQRR